MFRRKPRQNLRIICERWEEETEPQPITYYIYKLRDRMKYTHELARKNLEVAQSKMRRTK